MVLIQESDVERALTAVEPQLKSHPRDAFLQYLAQILFECGLEQARRRSGLGGCSKPIDRTQARLHSDTGPAAQFVSEVRAD